VALLARSGAPLVLDAVDHMITNAISLVGSRGHLCGAFAKILSLFESGRLPLQAIVTRVLDGPEELKAALAAPGHLLTDNCKVLVRLDGGGGGGGGGVRGAA
jgi:threonine 3-dehydrogenase